MTYVITSPCIGIKDGACVDACPVDCIHPSRADPDYAHFNQLFINPEECIDCGACEPACPVAAIFEESAVPAHEQPFIALNAAHYQPSAERAGR